jgi:hypothetical protein
MIPKYRAWDKTEKKMYPVIVMDLVPEEGGLLLGKGKGPVSWDDVELLPYIGYKDMNGAEIYKRDILKATMITGKAMDLARRQNVELATVYFQVDYIRGAFLLNGLNVHKNILVTCLFKDKNYNKERIRGSAHFKVEGEEDRYYRFDDFERIGYLQRE